MAKNKKNAYAKENINAQANQYYTYHPYYGYIPADANMNENEQAYNQDQSMQNPYYQDQYQPQYPPHFGQGYARAYGRNYGGGYHAYGPMHANHMMQMQAMQEEINQLRNANNANTNNAKSEQASISPEKIQEIYTVVDEISQGKAGPEKLLPFMQNTSTDFWKGLAIGAGAVLLYNCTPLKDMVGNLLAASGLANFMPQSDNADYSDDGFDDSFDEE